MASQRKSCQTEEGQALSFGGVFWKETISFDIHLSNGVRSYNQPNLSSFFLPENIWYNNEVYRAKF